MKTASYLKYGLLACSFLSLSGCGLMSLPPGYSDIEKQTLAELNTANYVPKSSDDREAILTQDLFAQAAFWSREFDLNPADLEAAINLSSALRRLGNPAKAVEVTTQTRALYPRDADLMTELGAGLIANNEPEKALKIIDSALYQRPQLARLWSMKGAVLDQLERFPQARQIYTKALQLAPNDPNIMTNVGLSYALEGDPRTAEVWLRRAANMPGASANVRQNLAIILELQGKSPDTKGLRQSNTHTPPTKISTHYKQPFRGNTPTKQIGHPTKPVQNTTPNRARLTMAGDPSKQMSGPKTAQQATQQAYQQTRQIRPATPQLATQAHYQIQNKSVASAQAPQIQTNAPHTNVLSKIASNNRSKREIAAQQNAYFQQLAQQRTAQYQAQNKISHQPLQPNNRQPYQNGHTNQGMYYPQPLQRAPIYRQPARIRRH